MKGLRQVCCSPICVDGHPVRKIKSPDIASNTEAFWKRAKDGTRTRDPNLGKVMLYQLSYFRKSKGMNPKNTSFVLEAGIFKMQSCKTVFKCNLLVINKYLSIWYCI